MTNTKEALRTALKPFAEIGAKKANKPNCGKFTLVTVEACRRAAEAYAALEASTDGEWWVRVPRETIKQMAERLDAGGRRLETAGNACEEVEAQLRALLETVP